MKRVAPDRIEEVVTVKEVKDTVTRAFAVEDCNGKEVKGSFYETFYILPD